MKINDLPEMKKTDNLPDSKDPDEKINIDKQLAVPDRRDKELIPPQQQGHIEFASSSSFSNQNSEEFNPISASVAHGGGGRGGGHIELRSSSSFSNYRSSAEFKPSRSYKNGHIEFGSSSSFSNHNSIEFKHPPKHKERSGEESPARSSISSDRNNISPTGEEGGKQESKTVKIADNTPGMVSRPVKGQPAAPSKKADAGSASVGEVEVGGGGGGSSQRKSRPSLAILRKTKREQMVKKTGLAFRVFGALFCLVSFSVMAMDRNKGWALDSFDRYKEFRYCMAVNVIGFTYSAAQSSHLGYMLATGKSTAMQHHHLRYYFDFTFDQMVTYLLISASSSAATRIDDWKSNWGSDKFPDMATAAVSMSSLAFLALAFSSLISGYALCISKSA